VTLSPYANIFPYARLAYAILECTKYAYRFLSSSCVDHTTTSLMFEYLGIHSIHHSPPSAQIAALVERATHLVEKTALEAANKKAADFEQESQVLSKEVASWKAKHAQAEQGALRHRCDTGFFVWNHSE
jgi:hypothetical protein